MNLLVIRLSKMGILGESKPCIHCLRSTQDSNLNIKDIYYSTKEGKIMKESMKNMKTCYISKGMRRK